MLQNLDTILYHVHPGDSISRIIARYYGTVSPQKRQAIIQANSERQPQG